MPSAFATPTPVAAAPVAALSALTAPPAAALPAPATAPTAALPALMATSTAALPAPATAPATAPAGEHAAWTVDALRSVWEHQRGRVSQRIDTLERAIAALDDDGLDAALQEQARRAAHMLAGSLGMFGFLRAARAAHRLELELAHPTRERAPILAALLASVRSGIREPVTLPAESRSRRSSTPPS